MRAAIRLVVLIVAVTAPIVAQSIDADLRAAKAARCASVTCSPADLAAILNEAAWKNGLGLLSKPAGNNCPQPKTGTPVSCDYLVTRDGRGADVIGDAGGASIVGFNGFEDPNPDFVGRYVPAVDPGTGGSKPPDPPSGPSGAATAELQQQQLALMLQIVSRLEAQAGEQAKQSAALEQAIRDLKAEIAKGVKVRF